MIFFQRNRKRFIPLSPAKPKSNDHNMGNGCTKNLRRLNKNSVAPDHIQQVTSIKSHIEPVKRNTNPFEEDDDDDEIIASTSSALTTARPPSNSKIKNRAPEPPIKKNSPNHSASYLTSPIDTNSIIFDKNESVETNLFKSLRSPQFKRSISVDSSSDRSAQNEKKPFSTNIHRMFKSNLNLPTTSTNQTKSENSLKFTKIYHRLSGSVHSLFTSNLTNSRKQHFSASDTNLNVVNKMNGRCAMSQQQLIDNDYCPSVLYNRKARKSYNEKNFDRTQTFSKWKNQLWLKFSRKKSDPTQTRKS